MFRQAESGSVVLIFALALPLLMTSVGTAVDLGMASAYKQRLTSATELACNQGAIYVAKERRNDLLKDYTSDVATIVATQMREKNVKDFTTATPVVGPLTVTVSNQGRSDFVFGAFLPMDMLEFRVTRDCAINLATGPATLLFSESFEDNHNVKPENWSVLQDWNGWKTYNAGVEINGQKSVAGTRIYNGNFFAELDSHCYVSNCSANSAMSRILNLTTGPHEIRYWYKARQPVARYGSQPACADLSRAAEANWVNSISGTSKDHTNRINVYVEKKGNYDFDNSNIVDFCVSTTDWVERVVKFNVPVAKEYRISWKAAGEQETYGGLLDYIRICQNSCP